MTTPATARAAAHAPSRTVLLGASFAGLEFVYQLARRRGRFAPGALTVVDPRAEHPYVPLAHELVSGASSEASLLFDTAHFCEGVGAAFVRAAATRVDPARRLVTLGDGQTLAYDRLVIAVGSETAVAHVARGHAGVVGAKWPADAGALRRLVRAGAAGGTAAPVVVVGAGLTGVEWGAELAAEGAAGAPAAVTLVDAADRVLPSFRPNVAAHAARVLAVLGVDVRLGRSVAEVRDADDGAALEVVLDDGAVLPAAAVVWGGGVRPLPALAGWGLPPGALGERGHVRVTPELAAVGVDGIYAIGDAARVVGDDGREWPTMARAIEAIWQGKLLARRFARGAAPGRGPRHRLRRDFVHGVSLGQRHSLVVYGRWWADARAFVGFRRLLKWAYYARYRLVAAVLRRRGATAPSVAGAAAPRPGSR